MSIIDKIMRAGEGRTLRRLKAISDAVNSIGTNASHGCVRMSIPDVEELYDQVKVGTPVYSV